MQDLVESKRGTPECGLLDVACVTKELGKGRAPTASFFFACLPPSPFPRCIVRVTVLLNQNGVGCEASQTVSLSAERVLESLEE